jgi:hypothetical protein
MAARADVESVEAALRDLLARGAARVDYQGRLLAIAGLSVVSDRHRIDIAGRTFWTWCAFDAIGILAAIGRDGSLSTTEPETANPITVVFEQGRPAASDAALLLPATSTEVCANVIEEWCSLANLFTTEARARGWARVRRVEARILALPEAADLGRANWLPLLPVDVKARRWTERTTE